MIDATNDSRSTRIIFLGSFLTILAAGVGFSVRAAILKVWAEKFGFTMTELGQITGGGLWAFGVVIIISSLFLDRVGYKPILMLAFVLHLVSAALTLAATPINDSLGKSATFTCLNWGMIFFAVGNGLCEAAVNPLVAALYPKQKTHYLNILHASWPGGLIVGGLIAYCFVGNKAAIAELPWEYSLGTFLIPVILYGLMIASKKLPRSEVSAAGISVGEMLSQFASPILILLLVIHAMVGYVELGTDSWITKIMDNVVKEKSILLFIYTSALMFVLRFFAGPIVERINPLGLLTLSGILGYVGLTLLSQVNDNSLWGWPVTAAFLAASVYALGKTFLWPTMLGIAGERFPRGGAIVMGTMGGIGMLSAGLLGAPSIGFQQDKFASQHLREASVETFERYKAAEENTLLFAFKTVGLDAKKVEIIGEDVKAEEERGIIKDHARVEAGKADPKKAVSPKAAEEIEKLYAWWTMEGKPKAANDKDPVKNATIYGGQTALKLTSYVPLTMAVLYLILVLYYRATGGYKQIELHHHQAEGPMSEL